MSEDRLRDDNRHAQLTNSLFGIDRLMVDNELLLVYRDNIDQKTTDNLLNIAELKMNSSGEQKSLRKKVFNILVECLQNIVKHADHSNDPKHEKTSLLVIGRNPVNVFIISGNLIKNEKIPALRKLIDYVNELEKPELKKAYTEKIDTGEYTLKGGAGLGLMDIARKSGQKLDYDFKPVNKEFSYFSLKVDVPT